jgi:hypothetical protein
VSDQKYWMTSGINVKTWIPPKGHFVSYTNSDRDWLESLGLGSYAAKPAELYDIRSDCGRLLGYSKHRPDARKRSIVLNAWDEPIAIWGKPNYGSFKKLEVMIERYIIAGECRYCWLAKLEDAIDLLNGGFLELCPDGTRNAYYEIRRAQTEREYRMALK